MPVFNAPCITEQYQRKQALSLSFSILLIVNKSFYI